MVNPLTFSVLPDAVYDEAMKRCFEKHDALALGPALMKVEHATKITAAVLKTMGMGCASSIAMAEATTGEEMSRSRKELTLALFKADPKCLRKLVPPNKDKAEKLQAIAQAVGRLLTLLVDEVRPKAGMVGSGKDATAYLVSGTEEERTYSVQSYDTTEYKGALLQAKVLHNMRITAHEMPTLGQMKKIKYAVTVEEVFPDPARVSLENMRRSPKDSAALLFQRLVYGTLVAAIGAEVKAGVRDDGAGWHADAGTLWFHGEMAEDLIKEVAELRDELTDAVMMKGLQLMHTMMHKATKRGMESPSLVASRMIGQVPQLLKGEGEPTAAGTKRARDEAGRGARGKGAKGKKGEEPKKRKGDAARGSERYPDEAGAIGPNGLPRRVGGNKEGGPCARFAKGNCPFKTCSYSHEKGPSQ